MTMGGGTTTTTAVGEEEIATTMIGGEDKTMMKDSDYSDNEKEQWVLLRRRSVNINLKNLQYF